MYPRISFGPHQHITMFIQSGIIRLLPLPSEWDGLAVARGLLEEMAGQEGEEVAMAGGKWGAAYMQVKNTLT